LTDSGGVQEEACILKVPCVTLRDNTERPETLEVRSNILAGANAETILNAVKEMIGKENNWKNPFGDGNAGKRIIEILQGVIQ
jgi:UDP-N-acetylglucosamine 2-epimerase (non-hydrolysing)